MISLLFSIIGFLLGIIWVILSCFISIVPWLFYVVFYVIIWKFMIVEGVWGAVMFITENILPSDMPIFAKGLAIFIVISLTVGGFISIKEA